MTRVLGRVLTGLLLAVPLALPGAAAAAPSPARDLSVMTQNLYLGTDLGPLIAAATPTDFLTAVAVGYGNVLASDPPSRLGAVADTIAARHPDLVGLEEVSTWTVYGDSIAPSLDYLAILQAQLAARGLHYAVAAVSDNADIGPVPLVAPCSGAFLSCGLRFQDRDVILARTDRTGLSVGNPRHGNYATQFTVTTAVGAVSFDRGWATVDASLWGTRFRFAVTHLETEDVPPVQVAQGQEFLAAVKTPGAVVAVGDFNSAADGSNTATYSQITSDYFRDAWSGGAGLSCCQAPLLDNATSAYYERIDLVLTHAVHPMGAVLVDDTPFQGHAPYWASDHAGVFATLRLH